MWLHHAEKLEHGSAEGDNSLVPLLYYFWNVHSGAIVECCISFLCKESQARIDKQCSDHVFHPGVNLPPLPASCDRKLAEFFQAALPLSGPEV